MSKLCIYAIVIQLSVYSLTFAMDSKAQTKSVNEIEIDLNLKAPAKLDKVLESIEKKTEFHFSFRDNEVKAPSYRLHAISERMTLGDLLVKISQQTELSFKRINSNIYIYRKDKDRSEAVVEVIQADVEIIGTVTDENGDPLPGATIIEKGTSNGTITDEYGSFKLSVPEGSTLVVAFLGYAQQEIKLSGQTNLSISLVEDMTNLEEVVVVAFGTQKEYSIVGSVSTVQPEQLQTSTKRSLSNNLGGRISGIIAVQRSGEPGYDNSNFWIRGISTFAGSSNPLVLIDGVERSLDNIDPAEIASFSVLKDAAASAVYGVRGANGVILINTKRGNVGKPSINIRYEQGYTQPVQLPQFLGAADYLQLLNEIAIESGQAAPYSDERIEKTRSGEDPDLYPDVNWLDEITNDHASNSRLNLTVSGGSDILRYSLVTSYYGENGIIARDNAQSWDSSIKLKRYNMRSNVDVNVTSSTLLRINIGGYILDDNRPPQSIDNLFARAFETPPYVHPTIYSSGEIPKVTERDNPYALATQTGYERRSGSKLESLFSLNQDLGSILPGLNTKLMFAFDRYSSNGVKRSKSPDYYNPAVGRNDDGTLDLVIANYGQDFLGYESTTEWGNKNIYAQWDLTYTKNFGKHYIDMLFLYNQRNYDDGSALPFRNQGIAGRLSYAFDHRYVTEFNFGYNGSENFAKGKRYGFFPSVAVGYLLSEEAFMKPYKDVFDKIKFRASYGLVGNDRIDGRRFAYITTIGNTGGYRWGVNNDYQRAGRTEGDYGVADLTWETVTKTNLGLELGLFNSIKLQADYFIEERKDIFMQRRSIPGSSGFVNTPWANYGKVNNRGVDLSLNVNSNISQDFNLSMWGTFTYAVNEIIEQDEPSTVIGTSRSTTGKPVGQIFGFEDDGLFTEADFANVETGELIESIPNHTFGPVRPGDIKYKDINNDGIIDDLDRTAIGGTVDPQIIYGFGINMRYKSFDFGVFFQGNALTSRIIGGSSFIPGSSNGALGNYYDNADDRWTLENPSQDVFWPRLSNYQNANNNQASTWWLRDMSMLRMKNIEVGYNFPVKMLSKAKMKNGRIFVRGDNLVRFSKFDLWDPELNTSNGFRYPIMKSISAGFDLNF
ncbi:SusC/RagA family TonB-linked outer membrane protein [Fulvivirga ligni]|uniref:SusC/RagA family TonB-linked outer membrane protein n=1 Tax=Fulvivirga ligni TaxID=2904246 RepID=UPI001F242AEE|nr:TonB-dependent receptor [Fulvivirga ligni]UII24277.1 TonB-dependent receptor [Fulvivirga ligni]